MDIIRDIRVKTRKEYNCLCCSVKIKKGVYIRTQTNAEDGQIWTVRLCDDCDFLVQKYFHLFEEDDVLHENCVADKFFDYEVSSAAELRQKLKKR